MAEVFDVHELGIGDIQDGAEEPEQQLEPDDDDVHSISSEEEEVGGEEEEEREIEAHNPNEDAASENDESDDEDESGSDSEDEDDDFYDASEREEITKHYELVRYTGWSEACAVSCEPHYEKVWQAHSFFKQKFEDNEEIKKVLRRELKQLRKKAKALETELKHRKNGTGRRTKIVSLFL